MMDGAKEAPTRPNRLEMAAGALRTLAALGLLVAVGLLFAPAYQGVFELAQSDRPRAAAPGGNAGGAGGTHLDPGEVIQMVLFVEAAPKGARLLVNDEDKGEVPAIMTLSCRVGEVLRTRIARAGYVTHDSRMMCQERERLDVRLLRVR